MLALTGAPHEEEVSDGIGRLRLGKLQGISVMGPQITFDGVSLVARSLDAGDDFLRQRRDSWIEVRKSQIVRGKAIDVQIGVGLQENGAWSRDPRIRFVAADRMLVVEIKNRAIRILRNSAVITFQRLGRS